MDRALEQLERARAVGRVGAGGLERSKHGSPVRIDVKIGDGRRIDLHREHAFRVERVDRVGGSCRIFGKCDQRNAGVAVFVVRTPQLEPGQAADLRGKPGMVGAHPVQQAVEPAELDPRHRAGQLGRAEVVPGKLRQPDPAADGVGAVVHVECDIQEVVAIGDHHSALSCRDDLVELQAERARVAERAQTAAAIGGAGRLAHVLDQDEVVFLRDRSELVHCGWRSAHVDGQNRSGARREPPLDVGRIERQRLVHLGKNGKGARGEHGVRRRIPRIRRHDHLVALADSGADQRTDERRRACVDAERVPRAHVPCELALEGEDFVRSLADAVVAEEVLALDHAGQRLELLLPHFHPAGEHRRLRPGPGRQAPVPRKGQLTLGTGRRGHASRPFWT